MASTPRRFLVAANWKMNGDARANADLLRAAGECARRCDAIDVLVCPAFVHIPQAAAALNGVNGASVGAQNVSEHAPGAHTGDVSAAMLREAGCAYVIVGHSERRGDHGETDEQVAARFAAVCAGGMTPIVCVGETPAQREAGEEREVVERQLGAALGGDARGFVVAYEPVWAIGTGRAATPQQVDEMHGVIRGAMRGLCGEEVATRTPVLYGGSVKADNAAELFALDEVDGALVGGASLDAQSFAAICDAGQSAAQARLK